MGDLVSEWIFELDVLINEQTRSGELAQIKQHLVSLKEKMEKAIEPVNGWILDLDILSAYKDGEADPIQELIALKGNLSELKTRLEKGR